MKTPLTPLEFMRRSRRLYPNQEAVVDGDLRLTYTEFFDRCDRWAAALAALGVGKGDRVAYIAPNTHAQLESFYSVPQLGAVLVPINYRLIADDFVYIINHSGAKVVCVHEDYLDAVEGIRDQLPNVEQYIALEGERPNWRQYEHLLASAPADFARPDISEDDLLFHDEKAPEPSLAYLLSRMSQPHFPEPIGVFRAVDRPRYEERLNEQIAASQKAKGKGDLQALFNSGETWTVE